MENLFLLRCVTGGTLTLAREGLALRYWPMDEMQDWHPSHDRCARAAYQAWQAGKPIPAVYD